MNNNKNSSSTKSNKPDSTRKKTLDYCHYIIEKNDGNNFCLIGVPKELPKEYIEEWTELPHINCSVKFWESFFTLSLKNRTAIQKAMKHCAIVPTKDICSFNVSNWNIFTDFLFFRYNLTLYNIANDYVENHAAYDNDDRKWIYDRLHVLRKVITVPRKDTLLLAKSICAYYLTTFDLITTGQGYIYTFKEKGDIGTFKSRLENFSYNNIETELENTTDHMVDLEKIIYKLTGLDKTNLSRIPIQVFNSGQATLDTKTEKIFVEIMNQLSKTT